MPESKVTPATIAIGKRIAALADTHGKTGEDIGKALGLGVSSGNNAKQGKGLLQMLKVIRLCELLETTPNQLLGFPSSDGPSWDRVRAVLEAVFESEGHEEPVIKTLTEAALSALRLGPFGDLSERESALARVSTHFEQAPPPKRPS